MSVNRQDEIKRLLDQLNEPLKRRRSGRLRHVAYTAAALLLGAVTGTALMVRADTSRGGPVLPHTPGAGGPIILGLPGGYAVGGAPPGGVVVVPANAPEPCTLAILAAVVVALGVVRRL